MKCHQRVRGECRKSCTRRLRRGRYCSGSVHPLLCHALSVWVYCFSSNSLIGLFACSHPPQFVLLRMRGKTPAPSANTGSFSLALWGFNRPSLHPWRQGVLFTYQSSHSPDLTENRVCDWQDFVGMSSLFRLLFPPAFTCPPQTFFPLCSKAALARLDFILLLVFGGRSGRHLVISLRIQTQPSFI